MNKKHYKFEIIPKDWAKRRKPSLQPKVIQVNIPDFLCKEQHFCNMEVRFDDGSEKKFFSRVIKNHITGQWTVDGMHVAVKVIELDSEPV